MILDLNYISTGLGNWRIVTFEKHPVGSVLILKVFVGSVPLYVHN